MIFKIDYASLQKKPVQLQNWSLSKYMQKLKPILLLNRLTINLNYLTVQVRNHDLLQTFKLVYRLAKLITQACQAKELIFMIHLWRYLPKPALLIHFQLNLQILCSNQLEPWMKTPCFKIVEFIIFSLSTHTLACSIKTFPKIYMVLNTGFLQNKLKILIVSARYMEI